MIDHLSYSRLQTYLQCPYKFFLRYIEERKEPISDALLIGLAVHHALSYHYHQVLKEGDWPAVATLAYFLSQWEAKPFLDSENWNGQILWSRPEAEAKDLGFELLKTFLSQASLRPVVSEQEFERRTSSGLLFRGRLDLIDRRGVIIDFKTKSGRWQDKSFRAREFRKDLQPVAYAFLLGGPATVEFHYLLKTKIPSVQVERRKIKATELERFEILLGEVAQSIERGCFFRNPTNQYCRYCYFRGECWP